MSGHWHIIQASSQRERKAAAELKRMCAAGMEGDAMIAGSLKGEG